MSATFGRQTVDGHRVPKLDAFGKGPMDVESISALWRLERARRLLMLRGIWDVGRTEAEPNPLSFEQAFAVMVECDERARHAFDLVLLDPNVGRWMSAAVRQAAGRTVGLRGLKNVLDFLPAVASSMAVLGDVPFSLQVPVIDGSLILPAVGVLNCDSSTSMVSLTRATSAASVFLDGDLILRTHEGTVEEAEGTHPRWTPLHVVAADISGHRVSVRLDDQSPFRPAIETAIPLDVAERRRWNDLFAEAMQLLAKDHPGYAAEIACGIRSITPLPFCETRRVRSSTSGEAFGGAAISCPGDAMQLAVALVHEMQHSKLNALMALTDLTLDVDDGLYRVLWRDDPRPLVGVLHGIYAFSGIVDFWATEARKNLDAHIANAAMMSEGVEKSEPMLPGFEYAYWRRGLVEAIEAVRGCKGLTQSGEVLIRQISRRVAGWRVEVSSSTQKLAAACAADERALWHAYHSQPDESLVVELADLWTKNARAPLELDYRRTTVLHKSVWRIDARTFLERIRLFDPERYSAILGDFVAMRKEVNGLTEVDVCDLVADKEHAIHSAEQSRNDPRSPIALARLVDCPVACGIRRHPDLILRLSRQPAFASAAMVDIATWLSESLTCEHLTER